MARASVKATPSRPRKQTAARPAKAAPANRGHGEKGVAKYDPSKHPRGPDGKFLSKGGKAEKAKAPKATKAAAKPPAKPKPPKKVGTAKQRKGLADQIRAARAKAKTPEAKKALLTQVRGLRQKRSEWKRGQGKKQVEPLPKPPKPEKKPKAPKAEKTPKTPKAPKAKTPKKPATQPDPRQYYESIAHLPPAQQRQAAVDFVKQHQTPAASVKLHGMSNAEDMHSIEFDGYRLHYPKGEEILAAQSIRAAMIHPPLPKELSRHTNNVYLSKQASKDDPYWAAKYNRPGSHSVATGGDGNVVFYRGSTATRSYLAHEMGHNLAKGRYGSSDPYVLSDFVVTARGEKPPTDYAATNHSEDFAESVMMYVDSNKRLRETAPRRYKVIDRMLKDPNYAG